MSSVPPEQSPAIHRASTALRLPARAAIFDGHFPHAPIAPGAWLLQHALRLLRQAGALENSPPPTIREAKFFAPCKPQDELQLHWQAAANGTLLLWLERDAQRVMQATLNIAP